MKRIKQIVVKNLFGMFNHTIPLHSEDRITIIHGPNGFGKTTILKLLKTLFNGNHSALKKIPFDEFRVEFDDNTNFWVEKTPFSSEDGHHDKQTITFYTDGYSPYVLPAKSMVTADQITLLQSRLMPFIHRTGEEVWITTTGERLTIEDILDRFGDILPKELVTNDNSPEWLVETKKALSVRLIETQRLFPPERAEVPYYSIQPEHSPTVTLYAQELAKTINKIHTDSSNLYQRLDRTFPSRVVSLRSKQEKMPEEDLRSKLAKLEEKRKYLVKLGVLDPSDSGDIPSSVQIDDDINTILSVYVKDTEDKLEVFDSISQKIDLLKTIINKRFLYKDIEVSRANGITCKTVNGTAPLESLSSGEQHELVLFYELLFKVAPRSLVLIDEPEISLHIVWQDQFLQDVQKVAELTNIDVLLATHSSNIIANRRDLVVYLEGPIYEGL